jgi:hypothetical protein
VQALVSPRSSPAKTLLAATFTFMVCSAIPRTLLTLMLIRDAPPRPDRKGDLLLAFYLLAVETLAATAGFLLVTAFDRRWRGFAWKRAALIGGGLGLAAPIARFATLAATGYAILPVMRSVPALGIGLHWALPGVLLGFVALALARAGSAGEEGRSGQARIAIAGEPPGRPGRPQGG